MRAAARCTPKGGVGPRALIKRMTLSTPARCVAEKRENAASFSWNAAKPA
jgi:hypothetical protein